MPLAWSETSRTPVGDGERAEVERLVVQHAEGQPVALRVGAARLVPADVGRVEGNRHRAQSDVEAADGAAKLVGLQHLLAERRVALPRWPTRLQRQPDRVEDVLVERLGEVPFEDRSAMAATRPGSAARAAWTSSKTRPGRRANARL